jgi:hypothetical protein
MVDMLLEPKTTQSTSQGIRKALSKPAERPRILWEIWNRTKEGGREMILSLSSILIRGDTPIPSFPDVATSILPKPIASAKQGRRSCREYTCLR